MQDLTPVGLSEDGKRLIMLSTRGVEFAVPVDEKFHEALRGSVEEAAPTPAPTGQLEITMESTLRPRDIQSRIRSGDSAEAVAAIAHTSVDKIMIYAGPVLAERAHIAQSAQLASIRRKVSEAHAARTLGEAAAPYFRSVGTHPDDVEWDAWRRDDGRWTVVAVYGADSAPQRAEFTYDVPGRYVVADNDEARLLTGEAKPAPAEPVQGGRRLSAVPDAQDALPLGDDPDSSDDLGADALAMVRETGALTADHADADWIAPEREGSDSAPSTPQSNDDEVTAEIHMDGAAPVNEPSEPAAWLDQPSTDHASKPDAQPQAAPADERTPEPAAEQPTAEAEPSPEPSAETSTEPTPAAPQQPAKPKKRGRAQVPSWDEIMFGGGGKAD